MSAFMQSAAHVDAIVNAATNTRHGVRWTAKDEHGADIRRGLDWGDYESATRIGRILMRENAESMAYRYNMKDLDNDADDGTRPIEYLGYLEEADTYDYRTYQGKPWRVLPAVAILKAIDGYEYQSCEHPEWERSEAHAFCEALRRALIDALPGYADANTWSIYDTSEQEAHA